MAQHLSDFPPSPLDRYRKSASFDWKQLKIFLDSEDVIDFEHRFCNEIQKYVELIKQYPETPALDELRRITQKKVLLLKFKIEPLMSEAFFAPLKRLAATYIYYAQDSSTALKYYLAYLLFINIVASMGTERHQKYLEGSLNGDIAGCLCLTEIAHGSNTKGMRTTATYDIVSKQFIIHTPDFEAAKCWSGGLGQSATHAIVFAHLVTPDGQKHGLHAFIINIRDPKTMLPYPGITICDMGEKLGFNGIDNGLIMFDHYRIPRKSLLNRIGDVTEDGQYTTPYKNPNKRHGASLGALSEGRIGITGMGTGYLIKAITIAIRYAAVRKQFSATDEGEEVPVLEYQTHQYRLLPYLALAYGLKIFCAFLFEIHHKFFELLVENNKNEHLPDMGLEIHAISSASKPLTGWTVRDGIQECREACAGHGYLRVAALGDIRSNHDANCTYEGENHVLIQQTSNWLLKFWPLILKGENISTPYNSVDFLNDAQHILKWKFVANSVEETIETKTILSAFQWLTCYLLKSSYEKYENLVKNNPDSDMTNKVFSAKNDSQIFFAKSLAVVYIQHLILQKMCKKAHEADDSRIRNILLKLFALYGLWCLEKHILFLYQGGYAVESHIVSLIQESILKLCADLKNDAVTLIDAIAQPDFIISSVLGHSDGEVYKHLEASMLQRPETLARPKWWQEALNWKENMQAKL